MGPVLERGGLAWMPVGALDPLTRTAIHKEFRALEQRLGKTVVIVTHHVREALELGDRIGLLERGGLCGMYTPAEFLKAKEPMAAEYVAHLREAERLEEEDA